MLLIISLSFALCTVRGVKLPEVVTPDMVDSNGYFSINRNLRGETVEDIVNSGPRVWDAIDKSSGQPKSGPDGGAVTVPDDGPDVPRPDTCTVLQSGVLECDGATPSEATNAAKRHLAEQPDAETCPEDGDQCQASEAPAEAECPLGWLRVGPACYDAAYQMRAGQRTARRYCRDGGGALLHPVSALEAAYFLRFFRDLWVGVEYNAPAGRWQWLDGTPLPTNVSLLGGPQPEPARRCVRLHTREPASGTYSFVKTGCGALHPFACRALLDGLRRRHAATQQAAAVAPPDTCPPLWTMIDGWCHRSPRLVGDWANAELWCNNHAGSKLVSLRSRHQELAVDALVGNASSYHIGMRYRRAPRNWGWMDGTKADYGNWKHGNAPAWGGGDSGERDVSCAYRHVKKDLWAAEECRTERLFVCAFNLADGPKPAT